MKYTKVKENAFKELALNAGIIVGAGTTETPGFDPATGTVQASDILCATSGGTTFTVSPTYKDFADDVDNAPKNLKEFKKLDTLEAKLAGTSVTFTPAWVKKMVGAATIDTATTGLTYSKITGNDALASADFETLWFICDYSDVNEDTGTGQSAVKAGFVAIKLNNALNTKGFEFKSQDKNKATGSFEFLAHYSNAANAPTPFEIYIYAPTTN